MNQKDKENILWKCVKYRKETSKDNVSDEDRKTICTSVSLNIRKQSRRNVSMEKSKHRYQVYQGGQLNIKLECTNNQK